MSQYRRRLDIVKLDLHGMSTPLEHPSIDRSLRMEGMRLFLNCIMPDDRMIEYPLIALVGIGREAGYLSAYLNDFDRKLDVPSGESEFVNMISTYRSSGVYENSSKGIATILDLTYDSGYQKSFFDAHILALKNSRKNNIKIHDYSLLRDSTEEAISIYRTWCKDNMDI